VYHHAASQLCNRTMNLETIDPADIFKTANRIASHHKARDVAFVVAILPCQVGTPWGNTSNGNQLWAVARKGELKTFLLRRETQPPTAEALRVDKVIARRGL
jgi:hypothetical protein